MIQLQRISIYARYVISKHYCLGAGHWSVYNASVYLRTYEESGFPDELFIYFIFLTRNSKFYKIRLDNSSKKGFKKS